MLAALCIESVEKNGLTARQVGTLSLLLGSWSSSMMRTRLVVEITQNIYEGKLTMAVFVEEDEMSRWTAGAHGTRGVDTVHCF